MPFIPDESDEYDIHVVQFTRDKNVTKYAGTALAFVSLKGTAANGSSVNTHPKSKSVDSVFSLYSSISF